MNKLKTKSTLTVISFIFLLFLATTLGNMRRGLSEDFAFIASMFYILSIGIYESLFFSWTISVYTRIMQSHVRTYLMLIGANILLWVSIRAVKWGSFRLVAFGDRMAWYMYYIPMIMIPLLFFFTALCVGEDENYRLNKNWNILFIVAIFLVLLVMTNDLHFLVFNDLDITIHPYAQKYSYGIGYYIVMAFIAILCISSVFLIIKKFSRSAVSRKASRLPLLVVICGVFYGLIYSLDSSFGIGYYLIDMTMFGCSAAIAFWEACIRTGLVHSNSRHKDFFAMATTNAQILSHTGEVIYTAENTHTLSQGIFETLKEHKSTDYDENTLLHISPIKGGYVSWSSDVSGIKNSIKELLKFNESLYEENDILSLENEQKKEWAKTRKLSELKSVLLTEALPYSEKIKKDIMENENATSDEMKHLLFETSMISTYLKRKVNLILTEQTEKCISTDEMYRAFLEVFGLLRFYGRTCEINITDEFDMSLDTAILCFDLYQAVIENAKYNFKYIYLNYRQKDNAVTFSMEIEGDVKINISEHKNFAKQKLSSLGGILKISAEEESYHFSLTIPN